jgi:PAS domain S-box-containing protein/putative nucleotidyltransferase with HDIG domain
MKIKHTGANLSSRLLILIFVILAAGILVAGYLFYSNYEKHYRTQVEQQLSAIADLKVGELVQWRKERVRDANQLFSNPVFSNLVQRYFEHPDDMDVQEQLSSWLFQRYGQYSSIFLLDTQGVGRIIIPDTTGPVPRHITRDAAGALQSGQVTILDLELDADTQQPYMLILIPVFAGKDSVPLGVVVMRIDPYQYLYPLINRWPTPSATAETLIVRRDGNDALFLNELKFQKDTALKLRIPLGKTDVPAVKAALGEEGIVEGTDYRGEKVIADLRHVPDSPWFMVARMDTSEVYAPLTQMLWLIIALVGALLIGAGAGVGLIWRQQNIRVYKERSGIADALRESEEKHRLIIDYSLDMIYTLDADGKFLFVSPASQRIMGYSPSEMQGCTFRSFVHPDDIHIVERALKDFIETGQFTAGLEYRTIHASGDCRWHTTSGNRVLDENGSFLHFVGITHDVTERRRIAESLKILSSRYEAILAAVPDIIMEVDGNKVYSWANQAATGFFGEEVVGKEASFYFEGEQDTYDIVQPLFNGGENVIYVESWQRRRDGEKRLLAWWCRVLKDESGNIKGALSSAQDITESKLSEEKLIKSYESLKKTLNDSINTMGIIVEMRDPYTAGHQQKVADLSTAIAREMKLEDTRIDQLRMAALIHDIGKMYVPSDILSKPGRLSEIEFSLIKTHAQSGYDIVKGMNFPGVVAQAVLQHHERLDGSGYPEGLKGEDTLLEAKILAVADVIEAMAADRPYRPALGIEKALAEISKHRGRLYEPDVVDTCLGLFNSAKFEFR